MAADAKAPAANGVQQTHKPIELAIQLPQNPSSRLQLHLTILASSVMLFLTSTFVDSTRSSAAMGSFVYAMPDVCSCPRTLTPKCRSNYFAPETQPEATHEYSSLHSSVFFGFHLSNGKGAREKTQQAVLCKQQRGPDWIRERRDCRRRNGCFPSCGRRGLCRI
jgi:hypothetical protein